MSTWSLMLLYCGNVDIAEFTRVLHLFVIDVVIKYDAGHMEFRSNINPWEILHGSIKNPIGKM